MDLLVVSPWGISWSWLFYGYSTYHGKLVAVKRFIWKALNKDAHKYYREVIIQHSLKHENIIEVFGMTLDHDTYSSLFFNDRSIIEVRLSWKVAIVPSNNWLKTRIMSTFSSLFLISSLNPKRCKEIFIDIVQGLAFVHEHNYAHLDIKVYFFALRINV